MQRKAAIKKKRTELWLKSKTWEIESLLWTRRPIPYSRKETASECASLIFYTTQFQKATMSQETHNILFMEISQSLTLNQELTMN